MKIEQKNQYSDLRAVAFRDGDDFYIGAESPELKEFDAVWYMRARLTRQQTFDFALEILMELSRTGTDPEEFA